MFDNCLFFLVYSSVDWDNKISVQFAKVQLTTTQVLQNGRLLPAVPNCSMGMARITKTQVLQNRRLMPDVKGCSMGMSRTLSLLLYVPLGLPLLLAYFSAHPVQLLVCRPVRDQLCVVAC